jgi:hypothetical protein
MTIKRNFPIKRKPAKINSKPEITNSLSRVKNLGNMRNIAPVLINPRSKIHITNLCVPAMIPSELNILARNHSLKRSPAEINVRPMITREPALGVRLLFVILIFHSLCVAKMTESDQRKLNLFRF